jgi:hypothetical protein
MRNNLNILQGYNGIGLAGWKYWSAYKPGWQIVPVWFVYHEGPQTGQPQPQGTLHVDLNYIYTHYPQLKPKAKIKTIQSQANENGGSPNVPPYVPPIPDPGPGPKQNQSLIPGVDNTTLLLIAGAFLIIYFIS